MFLLPNELSHRIVSWPELDGQLNRWNSIVIHKTRFLCDTNALSLWCKAYLLIQVFLPESKLMSAWLPEKELLSSVLYWDTPCQKFCFYPVLHPSFVFRSGQKNSLNGRAKVTFVKQYISCSIVVTFHSSCNTEAGEGKKASVAPNREPTPSISPPLQFLASFSNEPLISKITGNYATIHS